MAADPPSRSWSAALLTHLRGLGIVTPWLIWLFAADVLLSLIAPLKFLFPDTAYGWSSRIAFSSWRWIQYIFEGQNGAVITTSGDEIPQGESAIVVANHIGWSDFYMIQALAVKAGMLGRCRWFAKVQLRYVPFLGWGLWVMGMPLVTRNWTKDKAELDRVFNGITKRKWPTWLISFSEATRFTPKKHAQSAAWCASHDKPQPQHLLYPRVKGFVSTVQHLRKAPHIKAVYDLTIAYQKRGSGSSGWHVAPSMWETLSAGRLSGREGYRFHVHVRRFLVKELPGDDEGLAGWLEERWVEKGVWLEGKRKEWEREELKDGESERERRERAERKKVHGWVKVKKR